MEDVEKEIAAYEARTGIALDAHQRNVLRDVIRKENEFWKKEAVRIDSKNSHDDY